MLIGCDLFTSSIDFQKLSFKDLLRITKLKGIKIIPINPKLKNNSNYSKIDIYWGNRINQNILVKMKRLKWIHYGSTGINHDILNYALKKNIKISNTKKIFDESVAATCLGFIFCLSRGIHYSILFKNKKIYGRNIYDKIYYNMNDVFKKKILFVGYGNIAKMIAKVCKSMDMSIYLIKRKIKKNSVNSFTLKNLNKAVKDKDFIVNLLPFTLKTKEIFDLKIFKSMNKRSFFINLGRGETVNERDLELSIKKNYISGAALDVVQNEPIKKNFHLLKYNNVIITPHIAAVNTRYKVKQVNLFSENLNKFLNKKKLKYLVKNI